MSCDNVRVTQVSPIVVNTTHLGALNDAANSIVHGFVRQIDYEALLHEDDTEETISSIARQNVALIVITCLSVLFIFSLLCCCCVHCCLVGRMRKKGSNSGGSTILYAFTLLLLMLIAGVFTLIYGLSYRFTFS